MKYAHQINSLLKVRRRSGAEWMALCPFHDNTDTPSLSINVDSGLWLCYGCLEKGNIEKLGGTRYDDSCDFMSTIDADSRLQYPSWSMMLLEARRGGYDEWAGRGISEGIVDQFGLGMVGPSLSIPTLDGLILRKLEGSPKYWNRQGMKKSRMLYASPVVDGPVVAICEGPIDALKCWEAGIPGVAIFGSHMSVEQERLLRALECEFLVIMTDNDDAGRLCGRNIEKRVSDRFITSWPEWRDGSDPGDCDTSTLRSMVANAVDCVL